MSAPNQVEDRLFPMGHQSSGTPSSWLRSARGGEPQDGGAASALQAVARMLPSGSKPRGGEVRVAEVGEGTPAARGAGGQHAQAQAARCRARFRGRRPVRISRGR